MAATASFIHHDLTGIPNQFQEIHALVQKCLDEKRKVLLILDKDGVQDDARLEVEKVIEKYLEKSEAFIRHIYETIIRPVISLCTELAREEFYDSADPFKSLIDYILLPERDEKDLEKIFSALEQSSKAKNDPYYLSYCALLKVLRKTELPASYNTVRNVITKNITSNTALICAMHLSTAICAASPLVVADKSENAVKHLAEFYQDFQHDNNKNNNSYVIQLTARTEAMAYTFVQSLGAMLAENKVTLKSLADQGLQYSYNENRFPLHPTSVIPDSSAIAASRNEKGYITHEFLIQNLSSLNNIHIIFVDDSASAHKDMAKLLSLDGIQCTLEQVLFDRNRTPDEKQALCVKVAKRLEQVGLETAIVEYQKLWTDRKVSDSAASAVIDNYVLDLLNKGIIDQDKIVRALNPNSQPQQSPPSPRVWSTTSQSTHFSLPFTDQNEQRLMATNTLRP